MKIPAFLLPRCILSVLGAAVLGEWPLAAQITAVPPDQGASIRRGGDLLAQNGRYGYHPDLVPVAPESLPEGMVTRPEEGRFYIDRFGRRFRVYRARPFHPGVEAYDPTLRGARETVPSVPPVEDPLGALRSPSGEAMGEIAKARPYHPGDNRYPVAIPRDQVPDLSQYPKPVENRDEPLLRKTDPAATASGLPQTQWPQVARPAEANVPMTAEQSGVPAQRPEMPHPWEQPAVPREQGNVPAVQKPGSVPATMPPREQPATVPQPGATTAPPVQEPPVDPYANLPFGKPVPGKKGFVTLEAHPNLPEIDVRGIAPGTPVEFPDPRDPSQIIQFRVPKPE